MMRVRRGLLFLVMLGALSLSFNGQVESVAPQLGMAFAVVFALSYDVATLLALHEVTTPGTSRRLRLWAWLVLIQAGGTALGLNTWHGLTTGKLPSLAAIAVGAGPVTLAWTLSHLIALALAERAGRAGRTASHTASHPEATHPEPAPSEPAPAVPAGLVLPELETSGTHPGSGEAGALELAGSAASGTDALVDRAERLERQALRASGGKQGISYRAAAKRLRVRYPTARAAVDAARFRITHERSPTRGADHTQAGSYPAA